MNLAPESEAGTFSPAAHLLRPTSPHLAGFFTSATTFYSFTLDAVYSLWNSHFIEQPNRAPAARRQRLEIKMTYQVIDTRTGYVVGGFKNKRRARNKCDQLDLIYGAVRYTVREVCA